MTSSSAADRPHTLSRRCDWLDVARLGAGRWTIGGRRAGESGTGSVVVILVVAGRARWATPGEETALDAGRLALLPESDPFELRAGLGADLVLVRIPGSAIGPHLRVLRAAFGRAMDATAGVAGVIGPMLVALAAQHGDYTSSRPGRLAQQLVGLLAVLCSDAAADAAPVRRSTIDRAKEFIELNLARVDLAPEHIAGALSVSTRTLHRLFEAEGRTLGLWIRCRRLEHCRAELSDPGLQDVAIGTIAARWGLGEAAHFSRLFKGFYGLSPRAYRALALAGRLEAIRPAERLLARA